LTKKYGFLAKNVASESGKKMENNTTKTRKSLKEIFQGASMKPDPSLIHITPDGNKWRVRRAGTSRAIAIKDDKKSAISVAKKVKNVSRIAIHNDNGTFKEHIYLDQSKD
jgi:hypothetical protein